jgi:hypothetical protein
MLQASLEVQVIERSKTIKVITLSTDEGPALDNWILGAKKLGYDYTILGRGEKWGGWSWRTQKYIEAIKKIPNNCIVLIVDGNDILFTRGPASLYRAYKSAGSPAIIFGGEPTCCVGKFSAHQMNGERNRAISTIDNRGPKNRWKFPNAGCIMGRKDAVLEALETVKDEPDDQAGHLEQYLDDESYLNIDWEHRIVGNVNKPGTFYCVDTSVAEDKNTVELQTYWEKVSIVELIENAKQNGIDTSQYKDSVSNVLYRNKDTGGVPCILHFAGKNMQGYNVVGATLYGSVFRPVSADEPISVGKSALLSVADLWKK